MSRRDVMKSLLRSAATSASERISQLGVAAQVKRALARVGRDRLFVDDARLTSAVARVPTVLAATVSTRDGELRIDVTFRDGDSLLLRLLPLSVTFAPHGAKEWSVSVEPGSAALDPRAGDIFTALSAEVARTVWGPFLPRRSAQGKTGFAHREGDVLICDLRTLPEVRAAQGQRLSSAGIDALSLSDIVAVDGGLKLMLRLPGLAG